MTTAVFYTVTCLQQYFKHCYMTTAVFYTLLHDYSSI
jgi:hypothetical protein